MQIACPDCQKQLRVPDSAAGKTVKCPSCGKTFQAFEIVEEEIQAPPPKRPAKPAPAPPKPARPPAREEIEEVEEEPAPRRRRDRDEEDDDDRPRRGRDRDEDDQEEDDRPRRRRDRDDDDRDDDDRPRRRRDRDDEDRPRRKRGSGAGSVTSVGVITIILGALTLLCGVCVGIGAAGLAGQPGGFGGRNVLPFQAAAGVLIAIAVLVVVLGVVYLMGGIGVLQRRNWGRIMTLVSAGFSALFGVLQLVGGIINLVGPVPMEGKIVAFLINLLVAFVFLTHCVMSFVVLLNSKNARDFD